jgi:hypothetical protein
MCFVWIWEQTAIISLYSINWLVFITETDAILNTRFLHLLVQAISVFSHLLNTCVNLLICDEPCVFSICQYFFCQSAFVQLSSSTLLGSLCLSLSLSLSLSLTVYYVLVLLTHLTILYEKAVKGCHFWTWFVRCPVRICVGPPTVINGVHSSAFHLTRCCSRFVPDPFELNSRRF